MLCLRYSTVAEYYKVPSFSSQTIQEDCLGLEVEVTTIVQNIGSFHNLYPFSVHVVTFNFITNLMHLFN